LNTSYAKNFIIKWNEIASLATKAITTLHIEPVEVVEGRYRAVP
jgi:hypothetical protein